MREQLQTICDSLAAKRDIRFRIRTLCRNGHNQGNAVSEVECLNADLEYEQAVIDLAEAQIRLLELEEGTP